MSDDGIMRKFHTGATRSAEGEKPDPEGFLSPLVMGSFMEYMNTHRKQADGTLRASDNWQKGIPLASYMKSMWRHFWQVWMLHRGNPVKSWDDGHEVTMEEALCALFFNVQGYLHEHLKEKGWWYVSGKITDDTPEKVKENLQKFFVKADELRKQGKKVFNPADHEDETTSSLTGATDGVWERYLAIDCEFIVKCRPTLYMMRGWSASRGARLEHALALKLGLRVVYEGGV